MRGGEAGGRRIRSGEFVSPTVTARGEGKSAIILLRSLGLMLLTIAAAVVLAAAPGQAQTGSTTTFNHFLTGFPLTGTHITVTCANCHVNARFASTPKQCVGCHNTQTAPGTPQSHPKTTNRCENCHLTTTWRDISYMDHNQTTATCMSCHNNNKLAPTKNPTHIAYPANLDCKVCHHNTVSFKGATVPPGTPGFGAVPTANGGVLPAPTTPATTAGVAAPANTPGPNAAAPAAGAARPANTSALGNALTGGDTPPANMLSPKLLGVPPASAPAVGPTPAATAGIMAPGGMGHPSVTSGCASCHNGSAAPGKAPNHIATNAPCETCHRSTVTFVGARMNHAGVTANCASCHNGMATTGKPANHLATSAPCETCHRSTVTFAGARVDHSRITAPCASCHNGGTAMGKPANHLVTSAPCDTCHKSTVVFVGARVDHSVLTASCASCHNGRTAEGKPAQHFITNLSCESCHRTVTWITTGYRHVSPSYVNHGPGLSCNSCHSSNAQTVAWKFPSFRPDCASCHVDKFRPMSHPKFQKPVTVYYTAAELRDCKGACHVYADNTQRTIVTRQSGVHQSMGGGW
jgi:hypothetical protein